jgi:hypothetical protein
MVSRRRRPSPKAARRQTQADRTESGRKNEKAKNVAIINNGCIFYAFVCFRAVLSWGRGSLNGGEEKQSSKKKLHCMHSLKLWELDGWHEALDNLA